MSDEEDANTQEGRKRKIGAAVIALWDLFNEVKTWKAVLPVLVAGYMGVDKYNEVQDAKRAEWVVRSEARAALAESRHNDLTNRMHRMEMYQHGQAQGQ